MKYCKVPKSQNPIVYASRNTVPLRTIFRESILLKWPPTEQSEYREHVCLPKKSYVSHDPELLLKLVSEIAANGASGAVGDSTLFYKSAPLQSNQSIESTCVFHGNLISHDWELILVSEIAAKRQVALLAMAKSADCTPKRKLLPVQSVCMRAM
jgi:hypothetical protein